MIFYHFPGLDHFVWSHRIWEAEYSNRTIHAHIGYCFIKVGATAPRKKRPGNTWQHQSKIAQFSHQVLQQDATLNYLLNSKFPVWSLSLVLSPNSLISDSKGTRPPRLVCSLFCCHCTYRLACTKEGPEPGGKGAITPSTFRFKYILKQTLFYQKYEKN